LLLLTVRRNRVADGCDAQRRYFFDYDLVPWHFALLSDLSQPRFHPRQACLLIPHALLRFDLFQPQHPAHLLDGKFVVQQTRDLFERQAQILECENAVEARQLIGGAVANAGEAVYLNRFEEPQFVVIAQRLHEDVGSIAYGWSPPLFQLALVDGARPRARWYRSRRDCGIASAERQGARVVFALRSCLLTKGKIGRKITPEYRATLATVLSSWHSTRRSICSARCCYWDCSS
jgi:hypothetical protein